MPPDFVPDASCGGMQLEDLWWDLGGNLHASISSWTCDTSQESIVDQKVLREAMQIWRLDESTWVRTDFPPAAMMEQLDNDTYLRLQTSNCIGEEIITTYALQCKIGDLYRWGGGTEHLVAEGVIAVSTPSR